MDYFPLLNDCFFLLSLLFFPKHWTLDTVKNTFPVGHLIPSQFRLMSLDMKSFSSGWTDVWPLSRCMLFVLLMLWLLPVSPSPCRLPLVYAGSLNSFSFWNRAQSCSLLPWLDKLVLAQLMYSNGCRRHWQVLEMMALTVSSTNRSWKGDGTFGCYLLDERGRKSSSELTLGHFDL